MGFIGTIGMPCWFIGIIGFIAAMGGIGFI